MAVSEPSRHDLHGKLRSTLGPDEADTLMAMLPPSGWDQVATKLDDIDATCKGLRGDFESFRTEVKSEFKSMRTEWKSEFKSMRTEWKSDLGSSRTEWKGDLRALRAELRTEIEVSRATAKGDIQALEYKLSADFRKEILGQTRTIIFSVVGILIPYAGVIFAAARLT